MNSAKLPTMHRTAPPLPHTHHRSINSAEAEKFWSIESLTNRTVSIRRNPGGD